MFRSLFLFVSVFPSSRSFFVFSSSDVLSCKTMPDVHPTMVRIVWHVRLQSILFRGCLTRGWLGLMREGHGWGPVYTSSLVPFSLLPKCFVNTFSLVPTASVFPNEKLTRNLSSKIEWTNRERLQRWFSVWGVADGTEPAVIMPIMWERNQSKKVVDE